jgi:exodeoxyribonuclease V beta subunit
MMHGFIDLVFEHEGKYFLCDYKSSHLGDNLDDYSQASLHENIERNHYDLQYLIYSVALHRYLKASLEDYDPKTHFGGSYYLYLRGMKASDMKQDNEFQSGVYFRQIELSTLEKFDALFSGKFPHSTSNLNDNLSTQELM